MAFSGLMLAKSADVSVLEEDGYIFEPKLDGYRALCRYQRGKPPALYSRNGLRFDFDIFFKLKTDCVLDGEIVAYNEKGDPDFRLLQNKGKAVFVVFDILEKNGKDLTGLALLERKKILAGFVKEQGGLKLIPYTRKGKELFDFVKKRGLEGVFAKKSDSLYASGRSSDWLKLKLTKTVDCVIIGYESGKRKIASLKLGLYGKDGKIIHVGNVGTGFSESMLERIYSLLQKKKTLVCEIRYLEFGERLRAPVFLRLREDKTPEECTFDQLETATSAYREKRDFSTSPEPEGKIRSTLGNPIFVVQRHDARRLHFDFRLEDEGVLKSWALPKGLPRPSEKRLAVQTEDHPLEYANFEGMIPEGNYGAGTVKVWDHGHFVNITVKQGKVKPLRDAIADGHFIIWLKGEQVEGGYAFTKMEGKNWLMVGMKDEKERKYPDSITIHGHVVEVTNAEKELEPGIAKGDLVAYYAKAAPYMLPHVKGRIISMYRFPGGVKGEKFFHKNRPTYFPSWVGSADVQVGKKIAKYVVCNNEETIVYLANYACVMHPWTSRVDKLEYPDKMIFDLDPQKKDLALLKSVALRLKRFLEGIGLAPFIMATGGKGYHIVVPIKRDSTFSEVRAFSGKIADVFASSDSRLTTELSIRERGEGIFIDVNRNSRTQTAVAPYSARPTPGFPTARPFYWKDLETTDPQTYNISSAISEDPWKDFFSFAVSIKSVIKRLTK